ncbi:MAG: hypothetical protein ACMG6E_03975, partial [Candidatus Roizmanbacteria bacterium]
MDSGQNYIFWYYEEMHPAPAVAVWKVIPGNKSDLRLAMAKIHNEKWCPPTYGGSIAEYNCCSLLAEGQVLVVKFGNAINPQQIITTVANLDQTINTIYQGMYLDQDIELGTIFTTAFD